jgi:hypothetical protein
MVCSSASGMLRKRAPRTKIRIPNRGDGIPVLALQFWGSPIFRRLLAQHFGEFAWNRLWTGNQLRRRLMMAPKSCVAF